MTPEQLEAHRVRFEQQSGEPETMKGQRRGDGYANHSDTRTWQAYQCGIADADRAQRAAPGVQGGEPTPWRNEMMDMAIAAGVAPNTIFHFEAAFLRFAESLEKKINTAQPPQQSAQPVAAANGWAKGLEIRMSQGWKLKGGICPVLYSDTVNGYGVGRDDLWLATTDALKSAQPVEVQRVPLTDATQFEKDVARWMEKDGLTREQAECEVNYRTTRKALKSGLSAHGIKPTSSEGGA